MPAGVLDTNTLILLGRLTPADLPSEPLITAVTLAELSVGPLVAADDRERAARQARLQEAESAFEPLPFDSVAARAFGGVAASLRRSGREPSARAFDALIAPRRSPTGSRYTAATHATTRASRTSSWSRSPVPTPDGGSCGPGDHAFQSASQADSEWSASMKRKSMECCQPATASSVASSTP